MRRQPQGLGIRAIPASYAIRFNRHLIDLFRRFRLGPTTVRFSTNL